MEQYEYVQQYAQNNNLSNTLISLKLLKQFLYGKDTAFVDDGVSIDIYFHHALSIAQMIIDLHPEITNEEEDIALSSALCHVLVEKVQFDPVDLITEYQLDEKVYGVIYLNLRDHKWNQEQKNAYYDLIQENKIALLVKLVDRSNIVEQLYLSSIDEAQMYVQETKQNFFTMCLYGKEQYPDLYRVISILMEKMRSLIDVTDILSTHYLERKKALNKEILSLKEENARIRMVIKNLQKSE